MEKHFLLQLPNITIMFSTDLMTNVMMSNMPTFPWVVGHDCVPQPTGGMCNRHCSVLHGVQLVQAAWLKAGGHEQQIAGCCDL